MDLYQVITDKIIEQLEKGIVPWQRTYSEGAYAVNWKTGKAYRGINALLLGAGEYATFKQVVEAGGKVKKGAKGNLVIFWKMQKVKDKDDNDKEKMIPILKKYVVFEINTQVEGLQSKHESLQKKDNPTIDKAKAIVDEYFKRETALRFEEKLGVPCYSPSHDIVCMPPISEFIDSESFYSTFFHEMVHSTGHKDRLNREGVTQSISFGSKRYSKEELIAEIGANMLCMSAEIDDKTFDNSVSYIGNWLENLKNDKRLILQASQKAQKAMDYVLGHTFEGENDADNEQPKKDAVSKPKATRKPRTKKSALKKGA